MKFHLFQYAALFLLLFVLGISCSDENQPSVQVLKVSINSIEFSPVIDKAIPVIMGEYGAISKTVFPDHESFREYYVEYVTKSMVNRSIIPFYWDNGWLGNHCFGVFDRNSGEQAYPNIIQAIMRSRN